ncbi:hypothetical protein D3C72_2137430 [compost metagenome]
MSSCSPASLPRPAAITLTRIRCGVSDWAMARLMRIRLLLERKQGLGSLIGRGGGSMLTMLPPRSALIMRRLVQWTR